MRFSLTCMLAVLMVGIGSGWAWGQGRGGGGCASGGGGGQTAAPAVVTAATGTATGTTAATNGTVFTGQGSLAYDMLVARMVQQQMAQRQYLLALQKQQAKMQKLERTRAYGEQQRAALAERRRRSREQLVGQKTWSSSQPTVVAAEAVAE